MIDFPKIAQLRTVEEFRGHLREQRIDLPVDDVILSGPQGSPLASPLALGMLHCGNRWCIHPMEGWDAEPDGSPSPLTIRRWRQFGISGAKLIWGGEAAAVDPAGRANPRQTLATDSNAAGLRRLLETLRDAHREQFATTDDLVVGLQLTHSGRFCKPLADGKFRPRIAYHHPLLDRKFGVDPADASVVWTDRELEQLIEQFVDAARRARDIGFQFVDVKACHGYLLHEFLSARTRPGRFGGDLEGRSRLLTTIVQRIRESVAGLEVVVRLSAFDTIPYQRGDGAGVPMEHEQLIPYLWGFGIDQQRPSQVDLAETIALLTSLKSLGVVAVNVSCGSPYYNPHLMRPAAFPPSDGYLPPEDPLVGVARQIAVARQCKRAVPDLVMVGSGYSYLQDYLPHVAQAVVREQAIDAVGLGRMVLSYPELPADTLLRGVWQRKRVCRTFSDCTTAPRNQLVSGCYPLDPFYKSLAEYERLREIKQQSKQSA
jgi:2,4-dienoyl-CoA reductase-like NADH-dependent reductase (Old Yellow Enzyme family)